MKTSELTGAALDWAVAKCEGPNSVAACYYDEDDLPMCRDEAPHMEWRPSTNPSQAYPIIYREHIACMFDGAEWCAGICEQVNSGGDPVFSTRLYSGPTPLIAAMRCYVASQLGDEVDVPAELTGELK